LLWAGVAVELSARTDKRRFGRKDRESTSCEQSRRGQRYLITRLEWWISRRVVPSLKPNALGLELLLDIAQFRLSRDHAVLFRQTLRATESGLTSKALSKRVPAKKAVSGPTAYAANATRRFHQSFYSREVDCVCDLQRAGIHWDPVLDSAPRPEHWDRLGSIDCECD
jgi:hypothetical protein